MGDKSSGIPVKRKTSVTCSPGTHSPTSQHNTHSQTNGRKLQPEPQAEAKLEETPAHTMMDSRDDTVNFMKKHDKNKLKQQEKTASKYSGASKIDKQGKMCVQASEDTVGQLYSLSPEDGSKQTLWYYGILAVVTVLSAATRFYNIDQPTWVCWDETHFGKMGSWYIKQSFFFDVHPPLGKMLIGLSGYLTGYDGQFPFDKPGDEYGDTKYLGMRMFCAMLGTAVVPLVYMSTWLLCKSVTASMLAASFVMLDTGTLTLSRHILLDPILLFFVILATYSLLKFLSLRERSFTMLWWFWLVCTGGSLACAIGVKFVGLFVTLLAGYSTIADLWRLLGNHSLPLMAVVRHFLARAVCLIGIPIVCYMAIFAVHFKVLSKSGNGDGFYSSQFQSQLEGNRLHNISMPKNIAYGSQFTLKQRRTGGGYLHSHWHLYPEEAGPRQQQITSYTHKDDNNMWIVKPAAEDPETDTMPVLVRSGDLVRLEHLVTRRNLHSHKEPAPVTQRHFQVSAYGQDGQGDANDVWILEVPGAEEGTPISAVRAKMQLVHYHARCALHSHDKKLPKWGFEQLEVSCNPNTKDPKTLWSIEEVRDPRLPNVSFEIYSPTFLEKLVESHAVMSQGNSGLKPKEGEITSRPWQWPLNIQGQVFSGKEHRIYLLGNPVIFWAMLGFMVLFLVLHIVHAVRVQRGVKMSPELAGFCERTFQTCWWLMGAWGLHYVPFWPMTRVLYFHHYFPAFLYSCMLSGVIIDYCIRRLCLAVPSSLSPTVFHWCVGAILSAAVYSFYMFSPLAYGMAGAHAHDENSDYHHIKWLANWEF